ARIHHAIAPENTRISTTCSQAQPAGSLSPKVISAAGVLGQFSGAMPVTAVDEAASGIPWFSSHAGPASHSSSDVVSARSWFMAVNIIDSRGPSPVLCLVQAEGNNSNPAGSDTGTTGGGTSLDGTTNHRTGINAGR